MGFSEAHFISSVLKKPMKKREKNFMGGRYLENGSVLPRGFVSGKPAAHD